MGCLQLPFIRVEETVSWTDRFVTKKFGPEIEVYLWQTNSTFQVNTKKNATGNDVLPRATELPLRSALNTTNDTVSSGFRNIYLSASWLGKYLATIHLDFKE